MTVSELIRILRQYQREYGDKYVVLADYENVIGDAESVGLVNGDIVISIE